MVCGFSLISTQWDPMEPVKIVIPELFTSVAFLMASLTPNRFEYISKINSIAPQYILISYERKMKRFPKLLFIIKSYSCLTQSVETAKCILGFFFKNQL